MKIKSITDVITNSSSEVFALIHDTDIDNIKKVINIILKLAGSDKTCDDILKLEYQWDYDYLAEYYEENEGKSSENVTDEELEKYGWDVFADYRSEGYIPRPWISVTPIDKVSPYEECAIQRLGELFADYEEVYC